MIKIDKITPLDGASYGTIRDLEKDFIALFNKDYDPLIELLLLLDERELMSPSPQIDTEIKIIKYLLRNFESILVSRPAKQLETIKLFRKEKWDEIIYKDEVTEFGVQLLLAFGYSAHFRSLTSRGVWLAQNLNVKCCPYCNAQYTVVVNKTKRSRLAKFQFDHFFSKDRFPYLSVSLYNLIPSCANCNITKSSGQFTLKHNYHPYVSDLSSFFNFKLKFDPDPKKLTPVDVEKQNLDFELVPTYPYYKTFVDNHDKTFHITGIYSRHKDIAEDLLMKAVIYTQQLKKAHLKIEGLFPDKATYNRYLIGNFSDKSDLLKSPLTKFTQDIAKQLELI